ncbi:MAG: hypothetical protein CL878_11895 [Dehalococcoidia bacterium]|nr:hypothetical protein [Dehalococcoidia bacterium]
MSFQIRGGDLVVTLDTETAATGFGWQEQPAEPATAVPRFKLEGRPAVVTDVLVANSTLTAVLRGDEVEGRWHLRPGPEAITSVIEVEGAATDVGVEVWLPFPMLAAIHHLTGQNWSARIDASCPVGAEAGIALGAGRPTHQLAAVEAGDFAIAVIGLSEYTKYIPGTHAAIWSTGAYRDEQGLWLGIECVSGVPMELSAQRDLTAVIDRYCGSLQERVGVLPREQDSTVPAWLDDIKVMVSFDLWRDTGEIAHTFDHVGAFCRDLTDLGVQDGVAIRLQGFQGPSGSRYPVFDPADELGGSDGLRAVADAVHSGGHRLMAHGNVWGMDPYVESFAAIEHLALPYDRLYERISTGQVGPYDGWPGAFPVIPTGYDSGFVEMRPQAPTASLVAFETLPLPDEMDAVLTIAGVQDFPSGVMWAVVNGREVQSSPGAFARGDRIRFRFRFRFTPEKNVVQLKFLDGIPDLSRATYRLNGSVKGGQVWSHPLVRADITHPEWIAITRNNLGRVAKEYGVDILYLDGLEVARPDERAVFDALRDDLPGAVFAGEASSELGYDVFRLTNTSSDGLPPSDTPYGVSDFAKRLHERFTRLMHPGHYFVPLSAPEVAEEGDQEVSEDDEQALPEAVGQPVPEHIERLLAEGPRWGLFPAVFLNYRDYGLDDGAKQVILEATQG